MCFTIPLKVLKIEKNTAYLEGGKCVKLGSEISVTAGEYVQIVGNLAVGKLSKTQGLKIRRLIKKLNTYA